MPEIRHVPPEYREAVSAECKRLLTEIAVVRDNPAIATAMVTPLSKIWHFFIDPPDGNVRDDLIATLADRLGVAVSADDLLVAVARRLTS